MKGIAIKSYLLATMIAVSLLLTTYSVYVSSQGLVAGTAIYRSWAFIFSVLVAMWIVEDSKGGEKQISSGLGLISVLLWPLVLLWYLGKTRGMEGVVLYFGFWALYATANVMNLAFYYVSS